MKPWILCTILIVVTACATEESKQRAVRAAMTAEPSISATGSPAPSSPAVIPTPPETVAASNTPGRSPMQGSAAHTTAEVLSASPVMPSPLPPPQLEPLPPATSDKPSQPSALIAKSEGDRPPPPVPPPTGPTVSFFDTNSFDKQLSSSLRRGSDTIVVTFAAFSSVNAIPERLNKWFSAVEKYDGTVQFQPDPDYATVAARGALPGLDSLIIGAFTVLYDAIANKILYGPAKSYNTTVYYIKGSGTITKIVFTRKPQQS